MDMKLFLTASTITPNLVQPFEELIGKSSKGLKAAFIPDAGYGSLPGQIDWIDAERHELANDLHWQVTEVPLRDETSDTIHKLLEYEVIYVNGGFSSYLAKEMQRVGFDKLLSRLWERDIVYVGSSGGSCVMSDIQDVAEWFIGEPEPCAKEIHGLGLIDFQIYPLHDHFMTPTLIDEIRERRDPALKYFLLKDGQAISIEDEIMRVWGDGVIFLDKIK